MPEIPNTSECKQIQKHECTLCELVKDTEGWCVPKAVPTHIMNLHLI